jgi:hypothetical protein
MNRRVLVSSFLAYAIVVCGLWAYEGLYAGFYSETGLIYPSETQDWWQAFFYVDPLRKFTSTFYHLSYLIADALGIRGSYVSYQVVYALLWFGRAAFTFLIVREIFPERLLLASLAGLLVAMHAGDASLNWIGQLNQHGFIFCMTAGFYAYFRALKAQTPWTGLAWAGAAAMGAYLSLWAYESPLPVEWVFLVGAPLLLRPPMARVVPAAIIAGVPVAFSTWLNAVRFINPTGTYQASIMRSDFTAGALASDLLFHVQQSIAFWRWPHTVWPADASVYIAFGAIVLALLLSVPIAATAEERPRVDGKLLLFMGGALALIAASYAVPIVIEGNRNLWRTEFLASVPAGMLMGSLLYAAVAYNPRDYSRSVVMVFVLLFVGVYSAAAGANTAMLHRRYWEEARVMMASLLEQVPRVKDGTLFVMRGAAKDAVIFGHNLWFDYAVKLAYPGTKVSGAFYFEDGSPAPGVENPSGQHTVRMLLEKNTGRVAVQELPCSAVPEGLAPDVALRRYDVARNQLKAVTCTNP